ncbi:uncharacterized protein LOC121110573 isoform X1 [Gallus gallus]|uniref:uncharacterized protein LOC121110573 isoform X1 n=1 Tax=Gallus gallus TaxID=9031 RepID=UPI001F0131F5|nr:uncharacterized protein LOC121110573 isoform X1 [Gallus gallus]
MRSRRDGSTHARHYRRHCAFAGFKTAVRMREPGDMAPETVATIPTQFPSLVIRGQQIPPKQLLAQPASELMKKHGINWTDARSEGKGALKQLTEQSKQPCKSAKKHHSNSFRTWPPPLTFHLAHPRLVNILWIGFDIEPFLVSSSIHNQCQDLPCSHIASFQLLRNCSDNTM